MTHFKAGKVDWFAFKCQLSTVKLRNIQYLQKDENGKDVLVYDYYVGKNNKQRIINGINVNYQPKWIPSLTVGLEQTYMQYEKDMIYFQDHIPVKNIFTSIANDRIEKPIIQTAFK